MSKGSVFTSMKLFVLFVSLGVNLFGAQLSDVRLQVHTTKNPDVPCGTIFSLDANFTVGRAGTVQYRFEAPPGAISNMLTGKMNFSQAGEGGPGASVTFNRDARGQFRVWVMLEGPGGNSMYSNTVPIDFKCGGGTAGGGGAGGGVRIGGWSLRANGQPAQGFQYTGSCPVDLKFGWGVIASEPTAVTYSISKSAGGPPTNPQTTELPGGGRSTPLYYDWHLGANNPKFANYTGWVELNIQSPSSLAQRINFTLHCGAGF
jgi:hypothetical protein